MQQITQNILMIRPAHFGFNQETAKNNSFQVNDHSISPLEITSMALQEFDQFVNLLRAKGVNVMVIEDNPNVKKPDAVFPNNWISFHQDGTLITYPMFSEVRRKERDESIIKEIENKFKVEQRYSLEQYEFEDQFLEGTGSMVLDRKNKVVYACLSPRTDARVLNKFCVLRGFDSVIFFAKDETGKDIYHTNVMMALATDYAVINLQAITNEEERNKVVSRLKSTNKDIIEISNKQMNAFAGNMLQVQTNTGIPLLIMSASAYESLTKSQLESLEQFNEIVFSPVTTIEKYGGGSVRCMMAEVFLPRK